MIDGEAVLLGVDGKSDFNGLHSRQHDEEFQFYVFDMLVSDGEDLRTLPLHLRKKNLARLLTRRVDGIFLSDFEQGEIGPLQRGFVMDTDTNGLVVLVAALAALFIAAGRSRCRNRPRGRPDLSHQFRIEMVSTPPA